MALLSALLTQGARADEKRLTADEIAGKILRTDAFGWEGSQTRLRMLLKDGKSAPKERRMDILGRRKDGLLQSLVRFLDPAEVAGTAFLMLERKGEASEQYVYLPGLKRTRRIVGREREGSFMGSDFTYADMQGIDPKRAHHTRMPDEKLGESAVYVLESVIDPEAKSSYSKVQTWVRQADFIALRTKFYDLQGKLLKTLYARKIKDIDGKPVVAEALMQNHQNSHSTELMVDSVERKEDMADTSFTPSALEHW